MHHQEHHQGTRHLQKIHDAVCYPHNITPPHEQLHGVFSNADCVGGGALPGAVQEKGGGFKASFIILAASSALVAVLAILFPERERLKRRCSGSWAEEQRLRHLKPPAEEPGAAAALPRGRV